jgi:Polyketide cyclase / dehydrase and lipid transport
MGKASASVHVRASLAETWDHYFEPRGWGSWVDGFQAVVSASGYPQPGATLRWRSVPAGRGTVTERVLEHEPRRRHRIAYEDPQSSGELLTELVIEGEGVRVTLSLDYRLPQRGPFAWLTDRLFVRGQLTRSLQRTLLRFKHEVEEVAALGV